MRTDIEKLREATESLSTEKEREELLSHLEKLQYEMDGHEHLMANLQEQATIKAQTLRLIGLFVSLPLASIPLYFGISAIITGTSAVTFQRNVEFVRWVDDPYLFVFIVGFIMTLGLVMLYLAVAPILTGKEP